MQQLPMQQLPMQQGQQQETKLLQATRLVLQLPRVVTILQGQQAAEEQQQVKARAQAAVLQAIEGELPAALKVEAAADNLKAYSEAVNRSSTITTTTDREPLGLLIFLIFALCIG